MSNNIQLNKTVSDVIDINKFDKSKINIVKSGTGSGKSWYFLNKLHKDLNIELSDILFITSRNITKEQQAKSYPNTVLLKNVRDINRFNKTKEKTPIITYNLYANHLDIIKSEEFKVIVLDEIHAIFSDTYNESMPVAFNEAIQQLNRAYVFGATATTEGLEYEEKLKGKLNYVLNEAIYPYKIKNIHIVYSQAFLDSILNEIEGNTICMLYSAKDVIKRMKNKNSTGLISKSNDLFTDEMQETYNYVVENKVFPEGINIMYFTSMGREGFEFNKETNIKNVIVQSSDIISVKQFVGRYRGHIDHLYIVNSYLYNNSDKKNEQQEVNKKEFLNLLYKSDRIETMEYIRKFDYNTIKRGRKRNAYEYFKYFIDITTDDTKIYYKDFEQVEDLFCNYITDQLLNKVIYTKEQKKEVVDFAFSIGIRYTKNNHKHNFESLMKLLERKGFNFVMKGKQIRVTNKKLQKYITEEIKEERITPTIITSSNNQYIEYLEDIKGLNLTKEDQLELLKVSNQYFNTSEEIKTISKLNDKLLSLGYVIKTDRIGRADSRTTVWILQKHKKNKGK